MNLNNIFATIIGICAFHTAAYAGYGTNNFFVTLNERSSVLTPQAITDARTNLECQPAENDLEGNWGNKILGEQLSIRFAKSVFRTDEPIISTIIFRNTRMDHALNCGWAYGGDLDFQFIIKDKNGDVFPDSFIVPERPPISVASEWIPGTQYKYRANLSKRYGLVSPGTYYISVRRKALRGTNGWIYVSSATASVKIVDSH